MWLYTFNIYRNKTYIIFHLWDLNSIKMSTKSAALSAYRNALRATRIAFLNDAPVLTSARSKIRQGYNDHKSLNDTQQIEEEIKKLNEVSAFIIKNIVQGKKQEDGKYFLNFHEKTELGDNDTIKQSKAEMGSLSGKRGNKLKRCS